MFFGLFGGGVNATVKAEIEEKVMRFDGLALLSYENMTAADTSVVRSSAANNGLEFGVYKRANVVAAIEGGKFNDILNGVNVDFGLLFFNTEEELVNFSKNLKKFHIKNPIIKIMLRGWTVPVDEILSKIEDEPIDFEFEPGDYMVSFWRSDSKIKAIKVLREQTGVDLKRAKDIVDGNSNCKIYFGTKEEMIAFKRAFAETESVIKFELCGAKAKTVEFCSSHDATSFEIISVESSVMAIKVYREMASAGLKEAKDAIDSGHFEIAEGLGSVQDIIDKFAEVGCVIEERR